MRLGILGPVLVLDDGGGQIRLAIRQRTLLAALLVHANRAVPVDRLAEFVWDAEPPAGAGRTLRSYVVRLRRDLGPSLAARLVTQDPGYLMRVQESELDTLQFEALCRSAVSALRSDAWAQAAAAAAQALQLWREEPLQDVPSQLLREQCSRRLEQLRLQAFENRAEALLRLGHYEPLLPELRELTAAHPLHERFHAQLMTALARSGRRAEALDAYQHARKVLVSELGLEPGPEVRAVHERVLSGESEPTANASDREAPHPQPAGRIPRQLPAAPHHFIGRQTELDQLTSIVARTTRGREDAVGGTVVISAIDGMAGIGKTALAIHAAHRLAAAYPDGQLFIDLHGYTQGQQPRTTKQALDWLLRALGVPAQRIPKEIDEAAALYRQRLADTRTLIVLDNASTEAQVRALLPGAEGCLVLVTSRRRLKSLDDARTVSLDLLSGPDAVALLRAVAGPDRISDGDPLADEVAGLCGYLPLALRIAAALLRHRQAWDLEHLAGLLRERQRRIPALSDGDRDLGAVFNLSYGSLTADLQRAFRRLGLVPGPDLDAYATAALADTDPAMAAGLLENLVDHNLLIEHAPGRYRLHDLLRSYARTLAAADSEPDRDSALNRLLHYYAHTAQSASISIARYPRPTPGGPTPPHAPVLTDDRSARAWLRAERDNLEAANAHAREAALHGHALALAAGLAEILRTEGPYVRALDLHAAAAETAERQGDPTAHANALADLGLARRLAGDLAGAGEVFGQALGIYRAVGNRQGEATALINLGTLQRLVGHRAEAGETLGEALGIYRAVGNRHGEATALSELGRLRYEVGDLSGYAEIQTRALEIFRALGKREGEAEARVEVGIAQRMTGDLAGCVDSFTQALDVFRAIGHGNSEAVTLIELGVVQRLTGDLAKAADSLSRALQIQRSIGHRSGQSHSLAELGVVQRLRGELAEAADSHARALQITRLVGDRPNEAWVLNHYAATIAATGDLPRAFELYRQALTMNRELNKPDDEAIALEGLAECHASEGSTEAAVTHLHQAWEIYQRLGMLPDTSRVLDRLEVLSGGGADAG